VALGLAPEALAEITALGYTVLETRNVNLGGLLAVRLAAPDGTTLEDARAEIAGIAPGTDTDLNHFYRSGSGPQACEGQHCAMFQQIGWPASPPLKNLPADCDGGGLIGMIDTGINPDHDTFAEGRLEIVSLPREGTRASGRQHGTAVASILIGSPDSTTPGLLPRARLLAVDTFHRDGQDERSDAFSLLAGLDLLAGRGVRVINLSLNGPPNDTLRQMIERLDAAGIVVVASAGNDGPKAEPTYPAAYPSVVAVTAVDGNGTVYRRAAQGPHIDLAAPGVSVWAAASIRGARPKTGTSFAAPYVTAAAYLLTENAAEPETVLDRLLSLTEDIGEPGRDPVFGYGLLNADGICAKENEPPTLGQMQE
jgi:subtilisin family serine protease